MPVKCIWINKLNLENKSANMNIVRNLHVGFSLNQALDFVVKNPFTPTLLPHDYQNVYQKTQFGGCPNSKPMQPTNLMWLK